MWTATDIVSGTKICSFETRKACAEWIEANTDKIKEKLATDEYREKVEKFKIKKGEK